MQCRWNRQREGLSETQAEPDGGDTEDYARLAIGGEGGGN